LVLHKALAVTVQILS